MVFMDIIKHQILLIIQNPVIREEYQSKRRRLINFLGAFLLVIRLINIMIRVFEYEEISQCIQTHYFVITGAGIHIVAQILSLKWNWASFILAPVVTLSYLNLMFCLNE